MSHLPREKKKEYQSYIKDIYNKSDKILIIGSFPPPLGGVSVYLSRLYNLLISLNFNVEKFDTTTGKTLKLIYRLAIKRFDVIHIQSLYDNQLITILSLLKKILKFRLYVTVHNSRILENSDNNQRGKFIKLFSEADKLITVGDAIIADFKKYKIKNDNVLIRNAFIPPPLEEEKKILNTYGHKLTNFLQLHDPLILANAFKIQFYKNTDLYGLDLCVKLTQNLKKTYSKVGFVFAIADDSANKHYLDKIKKEISRNKIQDNFYFLTGQKEIWPLFKKVNLFIRPSNTDGDAVSIREALYFKCPVVASDICARPHKTILFKNRVQSELNNKVLESLKCQK